MGRIFIPWLGSLTGELPKIKAWGDGGDDSRNLHVAAAGRGGRIGKELFPVCFSCYDGPLSYCVLDYILSATVKTHHEGKISSCFKWKNIYT